MGRKIILIYKLEILALCQKLLFIKKIQKKKERKNNEKINFNSRFVITNKY